MAEITYGRSHADSARIMVQIALLWAEGTFPRCKDYVIWFTYPGICGQFWSRCFFEPSDMIEGRKF